MLPYRSRSNATLCCPGNDSHLSTSKLKNWFYYRSPGTARSLRRLIAVHTAAQVEVMGLYLMQVFAVRTLNDDQRSAAVALTEACMLACFCIIMTADDIAHTEHAAQANDSTDRNPFRASSTRRDSSCLEFARGNRANRQRHAAKPIHVVMKFCWLKWRMFQGSQTFFMKQ